jgi:hypothetical protein
MELFLQFSFDLFTDLTLRLASALANSRSERRHRQY